MELKEIIVNEYKRRPLMEAADFLKLIYQNEFGGAHIGFCAVQSRESLEAEWDAVPKAEDELYESIGNGLCRANIGRVRQLGVTLDTFARIFHFSTKGTPGNESSFSYKVGTLLELARNGEIPVNADEIEGLYAYMEERDFAPIGHSPAYNARYNPHYRIIMREAALFLPLFARIDALLDEKGGAILAIDGPCGSGKSLLGEMLSFVYNCDVVHTDDFFLPHELKRADRLAEPGGNIDYERFESQALPFLGEGFSYRPYSCKTKAFGSPLSIRKTPLTVVEGAYSHHPKFADKYDLKVFLYADSKAQRKRIEKREGKDKWESFEKLWIPLENEYFSKLKIKEKADFCIFTGE